jgi:hypothetical protein
MIPDTRREKSMPFDMVSEAHTINAETRHSRQESIIRKSLFQLLALAEPILSRFQSGNVRK